MAYFNWWVALQPSLWSESMRKALTYPILLLQKEQTKMRLFSLAYFNWWVVLQPSLWSESIRKALTYPIPLLQEPSSLICRTFRNVPTEVSVVEWLRSLLMLDRSKHYRFKSSHVPLVLLNKKLEQLSNFMSTGNGFLSTGNGYKCHIYVGFGDLVILD